MTSPQTWATAHSSVRTRIASFGNCTPDLAPRSSTAAGWRGWPPTRSGSHTTGWWPTWRRPASGVFSARAMRELDVMEIPPRDAMNAYRKKGMHVQEGYKGYTETAYAAEWTQLIQTKKGALSATPNASISEFMSGEMIALID